MPKANCAPNTNRNRIGSPNLNRRPVGADPLILPEPPWVDGGLLKLIVLSLMLIPEASERELRIVRRSGAGRVLFQVQAVLSLLPVVGPDKQLKER